VYVDGDKLTADGINIDDQMNVLKAAVNAEMPAYSKITKIEVMDQPFEKTPKMSIKRFMYK
jgi:long-chain acyl-CoA synthetase